MSVTTTIGPLDCAELERRIDEFLAIASDQPDEYWTKDNFIRELPSKWQLSLAAWVSGRPIGYAIVSRKTQQTAHLHHFMIAPSNRGYGLGERLLKSALSRCLAQGCSEMTLKVSASNQIAQRFYLKQGFADIGEENGYRVMRRII